MFNKDFAIKGIHADYIRYLTGSSEGKTLSKSSKIFDFGYQVLFVAPIIGLLYNLKSDVVENDSMNFTIPTKQIINNKGKLERTYRMVLLSDKSINLDNDKRIDFVFRPNEVEKEEGQKLFDSYVRGGIEWLYNEIAKDGGSADDYLNNIISAIGEFTMEFGIYREEDIEERIREVEAEYS